MLVTPEIRTYSSHKFYIECMYTNTNPKMFINILIKHVKVEDATWNQEIPDGYIMTGLITSNSKGALIW